jgi:hypothetical protein
VEDKNELITDIGIAAAVKVGLMPTPFILGLVCLIVK